MTTEHDFDRIARAWLELSPDEAPDGVIAAVLDAVAATPQVGSWRRSAWRPFRMNRLVTTFVAAALVAAVGGIVLLNRPSSSSIGGPTAPPASTAPPTPTPTAPPTPTPTAASSAGWVETGELEAGTYQTVNLDVRSKPGEADNGQSSPGAVTFTVPTGWANTNDDRSRLGLMPAADYANPDSVAGKEFAIWIFSRIEGASQDAGCPYEGVKPSIGTSPDAYVDWIASRASVKASDIHDITVGGRPGRWVDVGIATKWNRACPWTDGTPYAPLIFADKGAFGLFGVGGSERARFVFVDLGDGDTVLIIVQTFDQVVGSSDLGRADRLMGEAMQIIASMRFSR